MNSLHSNLPGDSNLKITFESSRIFESQNHIRDSNHKIIWRFESQNYIWISPEIQISKGNSNLRGNSLKKQIEPFNFSGIANLVNLFQWRSKFYHNITTPATPENFPQYHILFPQHHISRDKSQIISRNVKCDIKQKNAKKK